MGVTPTVFVDLQALHSASGDHTGAFTAAAVKGPHMALPIVTREMIAESLKKVNPRSAGGPTGWTFRLIKDMWLDGGDTFQNAVLKIVLTLCGGIRGGWRNADGSETLFSVIARTSRLIALPKKDGKPRPISIGDVFIRLAARCLVSATDTAALLLPGQFGVGSPGGVEPLIHLLRARRPNFLVLKLDVLNAFHEVERGAIINEAARVPGAVSIRHVGIRHAVGVARQDERLHDAAHREPAWRAAGLPVVALPLLARVAQRAGQTRGGAAAACCGWDGACPARRGRGGAKPGRREVLPPHGPGQRLCICVPRRHVRNLPHGG